MTLLDIAIVLTADFGGWAFGTAMQMRRDRKHLRSIIDKLQDACRLGDLARQELMAHLLEREEYHRAIIAWVRSKEKQA